TEVGCATGTVATAKPSCNVPAGTVSYAGTAATAGLLLERATRTPPDGAMPLRLTVPVKLRPPWKGFGWTLRKLGPGGTTVSSAVRFTPKGAAWIVTTTDWATGTVLIGKLAVVCPAGNTRLSGTTATAGLSLRSFTTRPPAPAGPLRVTMPFVEPVPPVT